MPSTPTIDLTPGRLIDKNGNYVLQQAEIYSVLQYAWAASLLPVTAAAFQERLKVSSDTIKKLEDADALENLVARYATIQERSESFKDVTYNHVVMIADKVREYARTAGGSVEESHYANFLECVRSIESSTDDKEKQDLKEFVNEAINGRVKDVKELQQIVQEVSEDLKEFQEKSGKDFEALQGFHDAASAALKADEGDLADIKKNLADDRAALKEQHASELHDKIVACTPLAYAWVPGLGIVATSVLAGMSGTAATKLASTVDKTKADIANKEGKVTDEARLVGDMASIDADLTSLISAIDSAVAALMDMKQILASTADGLTAFLKLVNDDFAKAVEIVNGIEDAKLVGKWDDLVAVVDKYKKATAVSAVEQTSLDDLSAQLHKQAEK
ncbi:hypothetical protein GGG16DRAFT_54377 [Schizophyllum commune]